MSLLFLVSLRVQSRIILFLSTVCDVLNHTGRRNNYQFCFYRRLVTEKHMQKEGKVVGKMG